MAIAPMAVAQGTMTTPKDSVAPTVVSTPGADAMTFSDQPNFVVSGVTDWTAVGGHGSDATLRTSEDLARVTSSLKSSGAAALADAGTEAKLRADLAASPRSLSANRALGEYYLSQHRYQQALPYLKMAWDLSQGSAEAEYDLALACRGLRDLPQAKLHVQQALAKKDAAEYHRLAGLLAEDSGDPYTAVQQMQKAALLQPSEENYFTWGTELLLHRAVWQAVKVFQQGVAAAPASERLRTGLGSALFAAARYSDAAEQLCGASDLQPNDAAPYLMLGRIDEAAPVSLPCVQNRLARFLEVSPDSAAANYLYAMAILRREGTRSPEREQVLLIRATTLDPGYAAAFLQLGILAAAQKHYLQAIDLYKKAVAADPVQPEAHYRLAVAYDHTNQPDESKLERARHEAIKRSQAEAVEQQRRSVKQFVVSQESAVPLPSN